jgi:hypothetical protein
MDIAGAIVAIGFLAGCGTTQQGGAAREVSLGPQEPAKPTVIAFPRPIDLDGHDVRGEDDLAGLVRMALRASATHPAKSREYLLKVADRAPGTDLAIAALAAAAITALNSGDRSAFLEVHTRLEDAVGEPGRLIPAAEVADVLALGRYMKGNRPSGGSPRLQQLLTDVERSQ